MTAKQHEEIRIKQSSEYARATLKSNFMISPRLHRSTEEEAAKRAASSQRRNYCIINTEKHDFTNSTLRTNYNPKTTTP